MNATTKHRRWIASAGASIAFAALALAACSPKHEAPAAAPASASTPATVAGVQQEQPKCSNEPRTNENDQRPRCGGMAVTALGAQAYRFVGGSGDPIDQVVCDIADKFVLDGKLFGVEFSGGPDGTYTFVRTPNIPGLHWSTSGRYHIEFPDGEDMPGTMTTEGGGTTTAGITSRDTTGAEHFTLAPVAACK